MAIGIDELDDEELELDDLQSQEEVPVNEFFKSGEDDDEYSSSNNNTNDGSDAITQYLKDNGIDDPDRIKFEDPDGNIQEKAWTDLSRQEQLNILRSSNREPEDALDDDEINFLNVLRSNGVSPSEYMQGLQTQIAEQMQAVQNNAYAQASQQEPTYTSDQLTDDELFILDLQARVPDITDEEVSDALTKAKDNPEFYAKQMNGIRSEYERLEQESRDREEAVAIQQQQEAYNNYSNAVLNEIANLSEIGDLDINMDSDDMDELADFLLTSDEAGVNYFSKALQDPQTLVRMAWFALHGEEIFNGISDYYNKQIQEASRAGYQYGYYANRQNDYEQQNPSVVVRRNQKPSTRNNVKIAKSIEDLDNDLI